MTFPKTLIDDTTPIPETVDPTQGMSHAGSALFASFSPRRTCSECGFANYQLPTDYRGDMCHSCARESMCEDFSRE